MRVNLNCDVWVGFLLLFYNCSSPNVVIFNGEEIAIFKMIVGLYIFVLRVHVKYTTYRCESERR